MIYGMLIVSLLWYQKLRKDLEGQGFIFNPYDACVANRTYLGKQHTVRFHVDDLLCSCVNSKANDDLLKWAQEEYGQLKPVTAKRGTRHEFLGMRLDFGVEVGACHVTQISHIQDMLDT